MSNLVCDLYENEADVHIAQPDLIHCHDSIYSDKCIYYIFDKYCDWLEAQMDAEEKNAPEIL